MGELRAKINPVLTTFINSEEPDKMINGIIATMKKIFTHLEKIYRHEATRLNHLNERLKIAAKDAKPKLLSEMKICRDTFAESEKVVYDFRKERVDIMKIFQ